MKTQAQYKYLRLDVYRVYMILVRTTQTVSF